MRYVSTRGATAPQPFCEAVLTGLAPDGGLLVPASVPDVSDRLADWAALDFQALALEIISLFVDDIPRSELAVLINRSYATFDDPAVTPLRELGDNLFVLELFHGPTLAFKDVALQLLGNLFEHVLARSDRQLNILGATSGDTGSAAIAGVRGRERIQIFVMFPDGGTSPLQALQMTTVLDDNVFAMSVDGSFDDCQRIMKDTFSDLEFKERHQLGAVNSVNWARVMAQIVYYFYAGLRMGAGSGKSVSFSVPTGNFGNIFAGYLAMRMGLPIGRLILATNENDILARFFRTGGYQRGPVHRTISPSMDIQVASNFERYLHYHLGGDADRLRHFLESFDQDGEARLPKPNTNWPSLDEYIVATSVDTERTLSTIKRVWDQHGYLLDPHSAVGVAAVADCHVSGPVACLATAHPAKFPDVIGRVVDAQHARHPALEALRDLPTRCSHLPASLAAVKAFVAERTGL